MTTLPPQALDLLHKYFGHKEFRPIQAEVITSVLRKNDNFVLMPTGGGKSLCYQLPALMMEGLTIVVSPLIALMKDQVDALIANGIPATFINSSLTPPEIEERRQLIREGKIKLLYAAPERLLMPGFLSFLEQIPVALFAIDEAHCISMWGHDFREEYRGLSALRERFPAVPIIAMTATATEQVQRDILVQLGFRKEADLWRASFDRPNLFYSARHRTGLDQVVEFVEARKDQAGIIYCFSRAQTERMAVALSKLGYRALPYHAGLDTAMRTRHQEQFIRGEVTIICATIAFGMGIDKPDIRYIIHYDLPKSVSGYYQETGRAGRDGLPSECMLLFALSDRSKQMMFIEEKPTAEERRKALRDLDDIVAYAESRECRRRFLLQYFGESYPSSNCGTCDNCTSSSRQPSVDATELTQMFLSCVVRVKEKFGAGHVIDILRGSEAQKVIDFRHHKLPTYGIGKNLSRSDWSHYAKQLLREGYLSQDHLQHNVLRVTKRGWDVLKNGTVVMLPPPEGTVRTTEVAEKSVRRPPAEITLPKENRALLDELKALRARIAQHEQRAQHHIFDEPSLYHMALELPSSVRDLLVVEGIPERRARVYGKEFITVIQRFLRTHPQIQKIQSVRKLTSAELSLQYFRSGQSIEEIARDRGIATSTVLGHLVPYVLSGEIRDVHALIPEARFAEIQQVLRDHDDDIRKIKEVFPDRYQHAELQLVLDLSKRTPSRSPVNS